MHLYREWYCWIQGEMKGNLRTMIFPFVAAIALASATAPTSAQSQALNGQIQGTISDRNNALVPSATVTATNVETGSVRMVKTDLAGAYRILLLQLGRYRVSADAPGFKRTLREGITLSTGQFATVDLQLEPGDAQDTVTITADTPIADAEKTDLGRVMNDREVHNLPLPTRNPYNFVSLQASVTGRPNRGFNFPQINVNGFARRVNYLLDGNANTRGDRAGAPFLYLSETYVNEIQLLTNGFAAEFGNTTGMIVNVVTPSGTNHLGGSVAYLFRAPSFYSRPFFFSAPKLPENSTNDAVVTIGGPMIKDRTHFYFGYEYIKRDDSTRSNRQVTISEENRAALINAGLPASIFVPAIPSQEYGSHYIFRLDSQLGRSNRLTTRFNHSRLGTKNNIAGGFNTMERSSDIRVVDHAVGVQLVSYTQEFLNELRIQFARGSANVERNATSGTGPSITISSIANFGSPIDAGNITHMSVTQVQDNFTIIGNSHVIKFGGGFSSTHVYNVASAVSLYSFRSIPAYVAARNGGPFTYDRYQESFGEPKTTLDTSNLNLFIQDDWRATRRLKLSYGLRYDLYDLPQADPLSPFPASRKFNQDRNNLAPRFGLVYSVRAGDRPLVLRAGAGIYYEPPWSAMYERALRSDGQRFFTLQFCGNDGGTCPRDQSAPPFPLTFSGTRPPGSVLPPQNIVTVSPDFATMYAVHSNVQLEQGITKDLSLAVGFVHAGGRHIPIYRNINLVSPDRFLADGRPVFSQERVDARFDQILMAESVGVSRYDALTAQLTQRFSRGLQFSAHYTLSRAVDDAPEQNVAYMGGVASVTNTSLVSSDPTNRAVDKGRSFGDQRHTFVMSLVARPTFRFRGKTLSYLCSNNQIGIITTANSGERFSVLAGRQTNGTLSGLDLNRDGNSTSDRPVGFKRNSGKTPPQFNLDLRYSRLFAVSERYRVEVFGEVQNLFNINSITGYNNVLVPTDPNTGEMIGPLPDFRSRNLSVSLESRQLQLGVRFVF